MKHATDRLLTFDLTRLAAVTYIISLWHVPGYLTLRKEVMLGNLLTYLSLGCLVFISGYVLTRKYPALHSQEAVIHFLVRRLLRVYPLYLVALLGYIVYDRSLTVVNVIAHLLCLNLVLTPATGEPLRTIWFVSMIVLYYFAYVGFVRMKDIVLVSVAGVVTLALLSVNALTGYTDERLAWFLPLFVAGIVMARRHIPLHVRPEAVLVSTAVFILCGIAQLANARLPALPARLLQIVWMLSGILPVLSAASWLIRRFGWGKLASSLCYATFCAYLFHRHIYRILLLLFQPSTDTGTVVYLFLVGVPLAFLVGFGVQVVYDRLTSRLASR